MQGLLEIEGLGTAQDKTRGATRLESACLNGVALACGSLARGYESGANLTRDVKRASELYRTACRLEPREWCVAAGDLIQAQQPAATSQAEALAAWKQACAAGDLKGCRREAQAFECGIGAPRSELDALRRFVIACDAGDSVSCQNAGWLLARVDRIPDEIQTSSQFQSLALLGLHQEISEGSERLTRARLVEAARRWPQSPEFAFVRACRDVDEGDWDAAHRELAGPLAPVAQDPAVRMLARMLDTDPEADTPWPQRLVAAWAAEGRPNLEGSRFLPLREDQDFFSCQALPGPVALTTEREFLGAFVEAANRATSALSNDAFVGAASQFLASRDRAARIVAASILSSEQLPEAVREEHRPAVLDVVTSLGDERPDDLFYAVWKLQLEGTVRGTTTLGEATRLAKLRTYGSDRRLLYDALVSAGSEEQDRTRNYLAAMLQVFLTVDIGGWTADLAERAKSGPAGERQQWGRQLVSMGDTVSEAGWLVDVMIARRILKQGSALTGRPEDEARVEAVAARGKRFHDAGSSALRKFGHWPLIRVWRPWNEATALREMEFFEELAKIGGL